MGHHRAGFEVVGVDIEPQPRYPFEFHQADALTFPLDGFDAIHASPPCQAYSAMKTMRNRREHPDLVGTIRDRLLGQPVPWVIENVFGAPLRETLMLCGSQFGLVAGNGYALRRHRYFEAPFEWSLMRVPCGHPRLTVGVYGAKARDSAKEKRHYAQPRDTRGMPVGIVLPHSTGFEAMGIDWMTIAELSEAIPPAYTEYIGRQLLKAIHGVRPLVSAGHGVRDGGVSAFTLPATVTGTEERASPCHSSRTRVCAAAGVRQTPLGPLHQQDRSR